MELNTEGWSKDAHLVVAVSTGVDSMSLLHSLLHDYHNTYRKLTCVHVNHGLRHQSVEEEQFLKDYCRAHHIELYVKHLDLSQIVEKGNSIQHEARQRRYDWFGEIIQKIDADALLTAHHLDDQLETIFYRLLSGRSTRSALGMSLISNYKHYRVCRPLLEVSKEDILAYQHSNTIPYFEDDSNQDTKYVRNDIRQRILPTINRNPFLDTHHLLRLKDWHDNELQLLNEYAQHFITHFVFENKDEMGYSFSREAFNTLNSNVKTIVMDQLFENLKLHFAIPQKTYDEWFQQFQNNKSQFNIDVTEKWIIQIAYDTLIIMAKSVDRENSKTSITIEQPGTYRFNGYKIDINQHLPETSYPLKIRVRRHGDVFKLNGKKGHKKVSRLFIDQKIIADERERIPVVVNNSNEIIAIGCLYVHERFKDLIMITDNGDE